LLKQLRIALRVPNLDTSPTRILAHDVVVGFVLHVRRVRDASQAADRQRRHELHGNDCGARLDATVAARYELRKGRDEGLGTRQGDDLDLGLAGGRPKGKDQLGEGVWWASNTI